MFNKWLLRRSTTWNELIAALEKVQLIFLTDNIKKQLSTITGKQPHAYIAIIYIIIIMVLSLCATNTIRSHVHTYIRTWESS